jgi:N6-adenosine-specific RNA methylase IME4
MDKYTTVMMDPPWMERGGGKIKRGADRHYPLVPTSGLPALIRGFPEYNRINFDGASLWMWATANFLGDAIWLMRELGAVYVTNCVWVKDSVGLGQRFRMQHEHLLYGRWGAVPVPPPERRQASTFTAPRGRHSEKPDESYRLIETHDPPGPRLEFFARRGMPGWGAVGNEAPPGAPPAGGEGGTP